MKKVRIMLTAMTVIAAVGGALAFKATTSEQYVCTAASGSQKCPNFVLDRTVSQSGSPSQFFAYTIVSTTTLCDAQKDCAGDAYLIPEN